MDNLVTAVRDLFVFVTGARPRFKAHGGTAAENLALQNIQVETTASYRIFEICLKSATRLGCVWCFRTSLLNSFLGSGVDKVGCSY